jgi:1,2-diacylglycerol 3-beta-galactosyltransferase
VTDHTRILILKAEMGFGHRSAARALKAAFEEQYTDRCTVYIVDPIQNERAPDFLRDSLAEYDRAVREMPNLYRLGYEVSDTPLSVPMIEGGLSVLLLDALREIVGQYQPHVIVCVYQNFLAPLSALFALTGHHIPVVTVITDLTVIHRLWYNRVSDLCIVPTEAAHELALKYGLPPERLKVIGIPVHPGISRETRPAAEVRRALGWRPDLLTLLVVGSKRVRNLPEVLRAFNHSGLPIQLIVVTGGDDDLYQAFQQTEWHVVTHLYNFVEDMPTFIRAADAMVCKAGGLSVTEGLAGGLPILLIDLIEGQETGNAEYVVANGAGDLATDPITALETLYHWWMNDRALLNERAAAARRLGAPRAAYEIAALAWDAAAQYQRTQRRERLLQASRLRSLRRLPLPPPFLKLPRID